MKKGIRRKNINFRQTHSERSATRSNINFGKYLKQKFSKLIRINPKSQILNTK